MSKALDLQGRTSYHAYEQGKVIPDIFKILKLASFFDVSVEDLVTKDIASLPKLKSALTLYEIEKIPIKARAGYIAGYGDSEWIAKLPTVNIPYKPFGIARAFEIDGDSMEPDIEDGSLVIGIKANALDFIDRRTYVVVTKNGIQCKEVRVDDNTVYLISKNIKYSPKHIEKDEVLELWEVWRKIKPGET
ncbi:MAG: LexA family transcriptional regulator [Bacteroidia bacterium]|nr:LexA family transcriptional regulator [Bacteroidia bacterium]